MEENKIDASKTNKRMKKVDLSNLSLEGRISFLNSFLHQACGPSFNKEYIKRFRLPFSIDENVAKEVIDYCFEKGYLSDLPGIAYGTDIWSKDLCSRLEKKYEEEGNLYETINCAEALEDHWKVVDLNIRKNDIFEAVEYEARVDKGYKNPKMRKIEDVRKDLRLQMSQILLPDERYANEKYLINYDNSINMSLLKNGIMDITCDYWCGGFTEILERHGFEMSAIGLYKNAKKSYGRDYFSKGVSFALKNEREEDAKIIFKKLLLSDSIGDDFWTGGTVSRIIMTIGGKKGLELCKEVDYPLYHSGYIGGLIAEKLTEEESDANKRKDYLEIAINFYERAGMFRKCGELSRKIKDKEKARFYQKLNNFIV